MSEPFDIDADLDADEGQSAGPAQPLTMSQIKAIVSAEIQDAVGIGSKISEQQRYALRMYQGRKIGNEVADRSQVVSMDVLETVEWAMPSLMRIFTGGPHIFEYQPRPQSDPEKQKQAEDNARLATEYVNHVFMQELDGFQLLYDLFKTALLEKIGTGMVYWEEKRYPEVCTYNGLTEDQLASALREYDAEPIAADERVEEMPGLGQVKLYDVTLRKWRVEKCAKVDGIPPEEFLVSSREVKLDDNTTFSARRKKLRVSDLVDMGFPFEEMVNLPYEDTPEWSQGHIERFSEDDSMPGESSSRSDPASREVWVTDCFIRIDEDGDGHSELRNILVVGDTAMEVLDDREVGWNPFFSLCPVPMPHKFYGNSLADLVIDIQIIRSTILRQIMDHIYLSVNPRLGVVEGMVEYDDLLTVRPGGLVRARQPDAIFPIELPQLPPAAYELFQGLEQIRGNRTGIVAHGTEIDASAINSTATGLAQLMADKAQKLELIARIFANGLKQLGKKLLRVIIENDTKKSQVYINGRWIEIDPSQWEYDMQVEVQVGLGAGQAIERIANLEKIFASQQAALSVGGMGYLVTPENLHETALELVKACGFRNPHKFFSSPEGKELPQPAPDPKIKEIELKAIQSEAEQKAKVTEMQLDAMKQKDLQDFRFAQIESNERMERERIESQERIAFGAQQAQIESAQIAAESRAQEGQGGESSE